MKELRFVFAIGIISFALTAFGAYKGPKEGWLSVLNYLGMWVNGFVFHQLYAIYKSRKDDFNWGKICDIYRDIALYWMNQALGKNFGHLDSKKENEQSKYH